MGAGHIWVCL